MIVVSVCLPSLSTYRLTAVLWPWTWSISSCPLTAPVPCWMYSSIHQHKLNDSVISISVIFVNVAFLLEQNSTFLGTYYTDINLTISLSLSAELVRSCLSSHIWDNSILLLSCHWFILTFLISIHNKFQREFDFPDTLPPLENYAGSLYW